MAKNGLQDTDRQNHPVWTVYDKLRSARLNVKYYGRRLSTLEAKNFCMELILAASAPSSAIAGLWFWDTPYGKLTWQYLGIIAAVAAVLKPLLGLTKKIKDYESVLTGYRTLEYDLMEIKTLIETHQRYDSPLQSDLKRALAREKILVGKTPETREDGKVKAECDAEVRRELPSKSFFIPGE